MNNLSFAERYRAERQKWEGMRVAGRNLQVTGFKVMGAGFGLIIGIFLLILIASIIFSL